MYLLLIFSHEYSQTVYSMPNYIKFLKQTNLYNLNKSLILLINNFNLQKLHFIIKMLNINKKFSDCGIDFDIS